MVIVARQSSVIHDVRAIDIRTCDRPPTWDEKIAPFVPFLLCQVAIIIGLFSGLCVIWLFVR